MVSDKLKNKAALMLGIGEPVGIVSQQLESVDSPSITGDPKVDSKRWRGLLQGL